MGSSRQQNTLLYKITAANTEVTWVGQVRTLIMQAINAQHNIEFGHTRLFFKLSYTANRLWMLAMSLKTKHLVESRCSCTYINFVYNVTHMSFWLFGSWISKLGKFLLKLKAHHLGKFPPRENNPLYGIWYMQHEDSIIINMQDVVITICMDTGTLYCKISSTYIYGVYCYNRNGWWWWVECWTFRVETNSE